MKNQGTFYGKGVKTQFSTFLKADDDILSAFRDFGTTPKMSADLLVQMERYVCMLYSKGGKGIKGNLVCILVFLTTFQFRLLHWCL